MLRRGISLLLIIGFVANSLATMAHAHADGNAAEHNARPHLHVSWFCGDRGHHHGDGHGHHQHHHCQRAIPVDTIGADGDHDSDALYVSSNPFGRTVVREGSRAKVGDVAQPDLAAPIAVDLFERQTPFSAESLHTRAPACALYLTLRALRI